MDNTLEDKIKQLNERNAELIGLLENIETLLETGNSLKPNSVLRSAILVALNKEPKQVMPSNK